MLLKKSVLKTNKHNYIRYFINQNFKMFYPWGNNYTLKLCRQESLKLSSIETSFLNINISKFTEACDRANINRLQNFNLFTLDSSHNFLSPNFTTSTIKLFSIYNINSSNTWYQYTKIIYMSSYQILQWP